MKGSSQSMLISSGLTVSNLLGIPRTSASCWSEMNSVRGCRTGRRRGEESRGPMRSSNDSGCRRGRYSARGGVRRNAGTCCIASWMSFSRAPLPHEYFGSSNRCAAAWREAGSKSVTVALKSAWWMFNSGASCTKKRTTRASGCAAAAAHSWRKDLPRGRLVPLTITPFHFAAGSSLTCTRPESRTVPSGASPQDIIRMVASSNQRSGRQDRYSLWMISSNERVGFASKWLYSTSSIKFAANDKRSRCTNMIVESKGRRGSGWNGRAMSKACPSNTSHTLPKSAELMFMNTR
mmetsp:Transcript_10833/g.27857  ORF Transcript_10833/g.27857 Transcript_10833/m.27857 type:complete len:292 (+) Transcript_10833:623-1498(+)